MQARLRGLRGAGRDRRLGRVMVAFSLFALVEFAVWLAVLLYAYARGGADLAGLVAVLQLLPAAVLAPMFGSVGDRLPRGTALSAAYATEAVILVAVAVLLQLDAPIAAVVVAAAAANTTISVARPIHYAALPQLATTPRGLVFTNAGCGVAEGIGALAGPIVAGLLAQGSGPWLVAALSAPAMLGAALLTTGLRLPVSSSGADGESALRNAAAGLRSVSGDLGVIALLLVLGVAFLVFGALDVLDVSFADAVLDGGDSVAGVLVGATGIGALIGAALAAGLAFRARLTPPTALGLVASGAPLLLMAAVVTLPPAVVLLAFCGFGMQFAEVAGRTLLQRSVDDRVLARVFAVQEGVTMAGLAGGAALAPLLIGRFGAARAYVPLGVGLVVVALLAAPLMRRLDLRAVVRLDVLAVLRRVSFLAAMSPPALQRLSQAAQWLDVQVGDVVVQQGDAGEAFYVIAEGRMSITVDGSLRDRLLGQGDGFGEIALLRDVPRTATVTAVEPCRLLRLERDDFLAAMTGSADGRLIANRVAAAHLDADARPTGH